MKKIYLMILLSVFLFGNITALIEQGYGKQNQNFTFEQSCADATYITIGTIQYPNRSSEIINTNMTSVGGGVYQYNITNTSQLGRYDIKGISDGCEETFATYFEITSSGTNIQTGNSILIFLAVLLFFILGGLLMVGFFRPTEKPTIKWTYFLGAFLFFLVGLNLISAIIPDAVINTKVVSFFDSFTAICFIMFWFTFGLLAVMWILTFFNTYFYNKNKRMMERYG